VAETAAASRPLPVLRGFAREFYGYCKAHELRFQRCLDCGTWRHAPRDACAHCGSFAVEWALSCGRGKLFSWTTTWQAMMPAFAAQVPYSPAIVELDEGVRLVSWIVDARPEDLELGMRLEVVFIDLTPEISVHGFRRAR
jgi:uncharacterized OB-fold protein